MHFEYYIGYNLERTGEEVSSWKETKLTATVQKISNKNLHREMLTNKKWDSSLIIDEVKVV